MIRPVPLIVLAQLFGTSLWFSANGVGDALMRDWALSPADLGMLTAAVQLGFILGTLLFAVSGLADRFAASRVFLVSAITGAIANLALAWLAQDLAAATLYRFLTGFALAGIYPVGMKLIVSWAPERRGEALAWLVGMLTLGTATPHLLQGLSLGLAWPWVITFASGLALLGGMVIAWLGDGPHLKRSTRLRWGGVFRAFGQPGFRAAALGYFGHMWELYAFWVLVPLFIAGLYPEGSTTTLSLLAFAVIGIGAIGCVAAGRLSRHLGSARVAVAALTISGGLCLFYPWLAELSAGLALVALLIWGVAVIADSAQFSALASRHAPADGVASALAIMNSIGFGLSALAIPITTSLWQDLGAHVSWLLLPGAVVGVVAMRPLLGARSPAKTRAS
ncbi:MFS transporter [Guyparkeria sp. SCN-R1]|uniref:MFS transporter n=1 Tax=Guyparkeria sp. SCN-R1 TaxID=2341113 RepID=UPI000F650CB2|nr:MFS transporter [Guyparkeria sp. SCN-R1]RRQ24049.1 MFS transporter [Guyparkeria sp. SCN-R1]